MAQSHSGGDETVVLLSEHPSARRTIVRMALMYTPAAIVAGVVGALALANLLSGSFGAIVGVVILGTIAVAAGFQGVTALRDLGAQPVTTRGVVERAWDKGTVLWMSRAYYALVSSPRADDSNDRHRRVFVVSQPAYLQISEGSNVEVEHWPHTNTVVRLSSITRAPEAGAGTNGGGARRRRGRPTR